MTVRPLPPRDDLSGLNIPDHVTVKLIEQPNRGPGAARNRALDRSVQTRTSPSWIPTTGGELEHLSNASNILNRNNDFYFANARSINSCRDFFSERDFDIHSHPGLCSEHIYRKINDVRWCLFNSKSFIHTSTVVYNYRKFPDLRFPEHYWIGEDLTFWIELATSTDKFVMCSKIVCTSGHGIHIYESSGWGTPGVVWRLAETLKSHVHLRKNLRLSDREVVENWRLIHEVRTMFALVILHEIKNGRMFSRDIFRYLTYDPASVFYLLPTAVRLVAFRMRSLLHPWRK